MACACTVHHSITVLLCSSCCWSCLGFSVPQIRDFWVIRNPETWKTHLSEKAIWRGKLESNDVCPYTIAKKQLVEHQLAVLAYYSWYLARNNVCELHFQDVLHDEAGNPKISKCFAEGPCWVLNDLGIDYLHLKIGNWAPVDWFCFQQSSFYMCQTVRHI